MITKSKQNWEIGNTVKVGFLTLQVVEIKATPGDYRPDMYLLKNSKEVYYAFTPHRGIVKLNCKEDFKTV